MASKAYSDTTVASNKSKEQIERLLKSHNVKAIRFTSLPSFALLEFVYQPKVDAQIPYRVTIKPQISGDFSRKPEKELDRAERQVWRVAYWWLKSKFEAIDFGLVEFQQEFLPYMLLGNGQGESDTVSQLFAKSLAGYVTTGNEVFSGLRPAIPQKGTED